MERIAGGLTGLVMFAAVLVTGLVHRAPPGDTAARGIVALLAGTLLGWLVFGPLGQALVKASVPRVEALPPRAAPDVPDELKKK